MPRKREIQKKKIGTEIKILTPKELLTSLLNKLPRVPKCPSA